MRIKRIMLVLILFISVLVSCVSGFHTPASDTVRSKAYQISSNYLDMKYAWGGQDFWYVENGVVDCSGLVINIYKEACEKHGFELPFEDTTASELHSRYTIRIVEPKRGDLVFMGDDGVVSHVAIFHQYIDGQVEFLDAYSISGKVGIRRYPIGDTKFISFGRIIVE